MLSFHRVIVVLITFITQYCVHVYCQSPLNPICTELDQVGRKSFDAVILVDTDGNYQSSLGVNQCATQQTFIADTLQHIKGVEVVNSWDVPDSRVGWIEFNRTMVNEVVSLYNIFVNGGNDVIETEMLTYVSWIKGRCDLFGYQACNDNLPTKLYDALEYVRDSVFESGNDPLGTNAIRPRFIIIFNNCKLPNDEIERICNEFEDYIRTGHTIPVRGDNQAGDGINVVIINQGYEGFNDTVAGENGDYIMCLTEYNGKRIAQQPGRNATIFANLLDVVDEMICKSSPTKAPTSDPTIDPTTAVPTSPTQNPTTNEPTTSAPSTSPTTNSPSTSIPTTKNPSTSIPTTYSPTTNDPTSAITSTPSSAPQTEITPMTLMPSTINGGPCDHVLYSTNFDSLSDWITTLQWVSLTNCSDITGKCAKIESSGNIRRVISNMGCHKIVLTVYVVRGSGCYCTYRGINASWEGINYLMQGNNTLNISLNDTIFGYENNTFEIQLGNYGFDDCEFDNLQIVKAIPSSSNPTTYGPTTLAPTSSAPTSSNPTTNNPTSAIPTTSTPTSAPQTAIDPMTLIPTSATPTYDDGSCTDLLYSTNFNSLLDWIVNGVSLTNCSDVSEFSSGKCAKIIPGGNMWRVISNMGCYRIVLYVYVLSGSSCYCNYGAINDSWEGSIDLRQGDNEFNISLDETMYDEDNGTFAIQLGNDGEDDCEIDNLQVTAIIDLEYDIIWTNTTINEDKNVKPDQDNFFLYANFWIYVAIALGLICICCIIFVICLRGRRKTNTLNTSQGEAKHQQIISMSSVQSSSNVHTNEKQNGERIHSDDDIMILPGATTKGIDLNEDDLDDDEFRENLNKTESKAAEEMYGDGGVGTTTNDAGDIFEDSDDDKETAGLMNANTREIRKMESKADEEMYDNVNIIKTQRGMNGIAEDEEDNEEMYDNVNVGDVTKGKSEEKMDDNVIYKVSMDNPHVIETRGGREKVRNKYIDKQDSIDDIFGDPGHNNNLIATKTGIKKGTGGARIEFKMDIYKQESRAAEEMYAVNELDDNKDETKTGGASNRNVFKQQSRAEGVDRYSKKKNTNKHGLGMIEEVNDIDSYLKWNYEDVLRWIMSLDDGVFVKYKNVLERELKDENVKGKHFVRVTEADIKGWGVKDFEHKKLLYGHIQKLLDGVKTQELTGGDV